MNFLKKHPALRAILIAVFLIAGLALTYIGWKMTGQLAGLGLMILGIIFLLTALFVYNRPFSK